MDDGGHPELGLIIFFLLSSQQVPAAKSGGHDSEPVRERRNRWKTRKATESLSLLRILERVSLEGQQIGPGSVETESKHVYM